MKYYLPLLCLLGALLYAPDLAASIYAGEIYFRQTGPFKLQASVRMYYNSSAAASPAGTLELCWGDGQCSLVSPVNGEDISGDGLPDGEAIGNGYRLVVYEGNHTYAEAGQYTLSAEDVYRPEGIMNLGAPNSGLLPFHIQAKAEVSAEAVSNHSPVFYELPLIDEAVVGVPYRHTPNAFDLDGDEIRYSLTTPTQDKNLPLPSFFSPEMLVPGGDNQLFIDPLTGLLLWDGPQRAGLYVVAIEVSTFRDGELQDKVIRDMVIEVREDMQLPPALSLEPAADYWEIAVGDTLQINATASASPVANAVALTATGGMFDFFGLPASFEATSPGEDVSGTFQWVPDAEDAREAPYQVNFRARMPNQKIANLLPVRIKVLAEPVSTHEQAKVTQLKVFPNPAGASATVLLPPTLNNINYQLTNAIGTPVANGQWNSQTVQLQLEHLPKGWYHLFCRSNGRIVGQANILKQ